MRIAQISDTHIDPDNPEAAKRLDALARCVAAINALGRPCDAVIHTGDMAHNGTPAKYRDALDILAGLRAPFYAAAGNRDDRTLIRTNFPAGRDLGPDGAFLQYSIDDHALRLVALDSLSAQSNMGDFCTARAAALDRALAEAPDKPTVLIMHHPPFEVVSSKYRWQFDDRVGIDRLADVLGRHDQVIRIFCGHAHRDAAGAVAGVPASCCPSVAIDLRLGDFAMDAADTTPVFQIHEFDGQGDFVSETRAAA